MSFVFYFPNETTEYPYVSGPRTMETPPQIGATVTFTKSDNPEIPEGSFRVTDIRYALEIVNQRIAKNEFGGPRVVLERVA